MTRQELCNEISYIRSSRGGLTYNVEKISQIFSAFRKIEFQNIKWCDKMNKATHITSYVQFNILYMCYFRTHSYMNISRDQYKILQRNKNLPKKLFLTKGYNIFLQSYLTYQMWGFLSMKAFRRVKEHSLLLYYTNTKNYI